MVQDDSKTRVKRRVLVGVLALLAVAAAVCALRAEKTIDALYAGARTGFTPYGSHRAIPDTLSEPTIPATSRSSTRVSRRIRMASRFPGRRGRTSPCTKTAARTSF